MVIKSKKVGNIILQNDPCLTYATVLVLWKVGSINEKKGEKGISHFIEHMLFKGTNNRTTSRDISNEIYNIGGTLNAFTSNETTGYYVKIPNDQIETGLDVLSDMLHHSLMRPSDIADEKKVVIQENKKNNSNPISYIMQNLQQTIYNDTPLEYDVGGFNKDILHFRQSQILKYLKKYYTRGRRMICISGNFSGGKGGGGGAGWKRGIISRVEKYFGGKVGKSSKHLKDPKIFIKSGLGGNGVRKTIDKFHGLSQAYIVLGFPAYSMTDDRIYGLDIIGNILAGNMSSRLFMRLREKYGLVYSIHYSMTQYRDSGYMYLYAGTNNEEGKIQKVVEEIYKELKDICDGGITEEEIEKMKRYIIEKSKMDDKEGYIFQYGEEYLLTGKITTRDEEYKKYEKYTKREIDAIIGEIIQWNKQKLVVLTDKKCRFIKEKRKDF